MSLDYPRLRATSTCPLCDGYKAHGLICCWPCFNDRGIGAGDADEWAERKFAEAEAALLNAANTLQRKLSILLTLGAHSFQKWKEGGQ